MTSRAKNPELLKAAIKSAHNFAKSFGGPTYSFPGGPIKGKHGARSYLRSHPNAVGPKDNRARARD